MSVIYLLLLLNSWTLGSLSKCGHSTTTYRYYFRGCLSAMAELVTISYAHGSSTCIFCLHSLGVKKIYIYIYIYICQQFCSSCNQALELFTYRIFQFDSWSRSFKLIRSIGSFWSTFVYAYFLFLGVDPPLKKIKKKCFHYLKNDKIHTMKEVEWGEWRSGLTGCDSIRSFVSEPH